MVLLITSGRSTTTDTTTDAQLLLFPIRKKRCELKVVDYNGCSHDVDTAVTIKSVEEIPDGKIKLVSIQKQFEIVVQWNDIDPDFIKFQYDYRQPV